MDINVLARRNRWGLKENAKRVTASLLVFSAVACAPTADDFEAAGSDETDEGVEIYLEELEGQALTLTYQAERRTAESGCRVATDYTGYSGTGFMDYGSRGTWIEWNNVNVATAGEYDLSFRYANGGASNRQAAVIVNGSNIGNVAFAPTNGWSTWKATATEATLRSGNNTIRVMANTDSGGPNLDSLSVSGGGGGGTVRDLDLVNFSRLNEESTVFNNVTAQYIVYAESHGRNGHNDIHESQNGFVDMVGARLVGYGGGRDKYLALFRVTSSTVTIDANGGAAHALFIRTSKTLAVTEARSIDPAIGAQKVPGARGSNEIVIYAEDEGGKAGRDEFYMPRAYRTFGSGDDLLYVFADDRISGSGPNGNGAYMRLAIF